MRKVEELVGYGLGGVKAPSIKKHAGKHLEAIDYHKQMEQKDTVIIDVRNKYESDIGHFQPPKNGAELCYHLYVTQMNFRNGSMIHK